ncbi:MAG: hypothetical protein RDU14_06920 [Melioribacteraceae bacterium]|nr:hypothetical protein [Melioribacteraceae bacterium]
MYGRDNLQKILILHPDIKIHKEYMAQSEIIYVFNPVKFNLIVEKTKKDFNNYIDSISEYYGDNIDWWVTSLASRNTMVSKSFLNLCYLIYADELINSDSISGIICWSKGLKKDLDKILRKKTKKIELSIAPSNKNFVQKFYEYFLISILLQIRHFVKITFRKIAASKSSLKLSERISIDRPLNLLDVFVFENSFSRSKFIDRYYNDFVERTNTKIEWTYLPTLHGVKNIYDCYLKMRKSKNRFLIREDYLKYNDYFWALCHILRVVLLRKRYDLFKGLEVKNILKEEYFNYLKKIDLELLLNYRLAKRLKILNIQISIIIDWFENQSIDKSQNLGFHKYYKGIKIIGYQGFQSDSNYLSLQPTIIEQKYNVLPDIIAVIGKKKIHKVKEFNPKVNVIVAPAFRFGHLHENKLIQYQGKSILIGLPIMLNESYLILEMIKSVLPSLSDCPNINVKIHPAVDKNLIFNYINTLSLVGYVKIVEDSIDKLLIDTGLMISSTSSILVESLAKGIPVIVIGSQTEITHNPIPNSISNSIWDICYSNIDLLKQIRYFLNTSGVGKIEFKNIGSDIMENYFEPVNDETIKNFLYELRHRN